MNPNFKKFLLTSTTSSACEELEIIQSLWSGYGKISRYQLFDANIDTVVVKSISIKAVDDHPRGWNTDLSHNRKVKSYEIETHWYKEWNQNCPITARIPKFLGSYSEGDKQWIILEDLNKEYPSRRHQINLSEIKVCLQWLAIFHATFLNHQPDGLWEVGTYWYLDTRPEEFEKIEHPALKAKAHLIDAELNNCEFLTIVHGDAKLANFCFSKDGSEVAAVDFQYVGGGCGMKDVAYFLGSCLSSSECEIYETELLDYYFLELQIAVETSKNKVDFDRLEEEWRRMYPIACTDFTRFLLGWMPSHQKVNEYNLKMMEAVLAEL